jgi:hypothetical protein
MRRRSVAISGGLTTTLVVGAPRDVVNLPYSAPQRQGGAFVFGY